MTHNKRWLIYMLVGLLFGVADWYYLDLLAHIPWGGLANEPLMVPVVIALNYGIWLVPVLPVAYHEIRVSGRIRNAGMAAALCWSVSILSYYAYYTLLLALGVLPQMEYLRVFGAHEPGFWEEWNEAFQRIILNQVYDWLPIAVIGGAVVGLLVGWIARPKGSKAVYG